MPRFSSYRNRQTMTASDAGTAAFKMADPSIHLSTRSPAALVPVSDFRPHLAKGHEWQKDAFAYNILVSTVGYLHEQTAELVASCDFVVVEDDFDETTGQMVTAASKDGRAHRVMRAFVGPMGGQKELKRRAALHYQIAGESILLATPLKSDTGMDEGLSWEFLSPLEVKTERKKVGNVEKTIVARVSGFEDDGFVEVEAHASRWWRSDAAYSARAASPMQRVLPLCRELVILSLVVEAIAKSRLNAGILIVPDEASWGPGDEFNEEGTEVEDIDKFMGDLIEHISAAVEDRSSAASLVPLLMKAPAEYIKDIKMLWLSKDLEETYAGLRAELREQIAQGLDAPPEIIQGKASLNHWSAYSVDNDFVDKHIAPLGEALVEFLTVAYLRRMLVRFEGMTPLEASRFRLMFDPRKLAQRSDEGESASGGWDRIILSDEAWLNSNGFTAKDIASEDERKRRILEKMVLSAPGIYGLALLPELYPELEDRMLAAQKASEEERRARESRGPLPPELEDPNSGPVPDGDGGPANGVPEAGPPTERPDGTSPDQRSVDGITSEEVLVERLATAADAELKRALERAASRVLTKVSKHPVLREKFSTLPKTAVLANMNDFDFRTLRTDPGDVIADAFDSYRDDAAAWIEEWAKATGASDHLARETARVASVRLCRQLDAIIQAGVGHEIPKTSNGLRIPSALVRNAVKGAVAEIAARS